MADLLAPEINLPFRVQGNTNPQHEQYSEEDVIQGATVVLRYERGERSALPTFGIEDPTFVMKEANARGITAAINQWEPNATVDIVQGIMQTGELDVEITLGRENTNG